MQKALGFIGLGVMGFPMAGHLATKGYKVSVFNRTLNKSQSWTKKYNGTLCESLSELAESSEIYFCVLETMTMLRMSFMEMRALLII